LGTILSTGGQTLNVTFTPTDAADYTTATGQATLQVTQATPVITWPSPAAITYGAALSAAQLNATANAAGTFSYSPALGTVLNAGSQALSVSFAPADTANYTSTTASATLQVNQATPVISWPSPAAITYGAVLSATQLNATASVKGSFSYSPAKGAVLRAGAQPLSVTFTPADNVNYATATAQTSLQVNQAVPTLSWTSMQSLAVNMPLSAAGLAVTAVNPLTNVIVPGSVTWTPSLTTQVTAAGSQTVTATFTPKDAANFTSAQSSTTVTVEPWGVACWGDSQWGGTNPKAVPSILPARMTVPIVNASVGGQLSGQVAVREGGLPITATITGGEIPATGPVGITFPKNYEPVTFYSPVTGLPGTIAGVHGSVTYTSTGLLFTRTTDGGPVPVPSAEAFTVDTPWAQYLPIFWEGRNDFGNVSQVLSDIAGQVATVPSGQDYLVLSILPGDKPEEYKGGFRYVQLSSLNNQLANIYGTHYLDVRSLIVNAYDPTSAIDVANYQRDITPVSLRTVLAQGVLANSIGPNDTSITVNLSYGTTFTAGMVIILDTGANAEEVQISSASGNTVTVVRGVAGATVAHAAGTAVSEVDAVHLSSTGLAMVADAIAGYLHQYARPAQQHRAALRSSPARSSTTP
jgi:hypothetical protein